jgi:transposase
LIGSLCNSLEFLDGAPQAIVLDNMKQAVVKSNKYEPSINKQLRAFACHYNTSILSTRSYKPKDKALWKVL